MPTLSLPDFSKVERPNIELPDVDLTKIDMPKFDLPRMDVGKAVSDAATSVGLMQKSRPRWPFMLGAAVAVAAAGFLYMNADMVRERLAQARAWASERMGAMNSSFDDEQVAFTAAEPKPIEADPFDPDRSTDSSDYPDGFGATTEMAGTSGDVTPSWEKAGSRR